MSGPLAPVPDRGRRFVGSRTVRLGDAGPDGRLRLDALARYLQDLGMDDATDAGLESVAWVARRMVVEVSAWPAMGVTVELVTFCSGSGGRLAERRTSVRGPRSAIETATLWVCVDPDRGRPRPLPAGFAEAYGESCGGRRVSGHLTHDGPPQGAKRRPWSLRATDFDPLGHVNNAAVWEPVEEEMTRTASAGRLCRAELEFRAPIPPGVRMEVVRAAAAGRTDLWLVDDGDGTVHVSARLLVAPDR